MTSKSVLLLAAVVYRGFAGDCEEVCSRVDCAETPQTCETLSSATGCACEQLHFYATQQPRRRRLTNETSELIDECKLVGDPTRCSLPTLSADKSTTIVTGGDTSCLFGAPYFFQVFRRPADLQRVALVFGGGIPRTSDTGVADAFASPEDVEATLIDEFPPRGIYSSDPSNVFSQYTIIAISMCTGDFNLGNSTRQYINGAITASHKGAVNVDMILDWLEASLDGTIIEDLIIVGVSGGTTSLPSWSTIISSRFMPEVLTIVADSSPSLLFGECAGFLLYLQVLTQVDGCNLMPSGDLVSKCLNGEPVDPVNIIAAAIDALGPETLYLEIASKADTVNIELLALVGFTALEQEQAVPSQCTLPAEFFVFEDPEDYYAQLVAYFVANTQLVLLANNQSTNYLTYIVSSTIHQYVDPDSFNLTLGTIANVTNVFATGNVTEARIFVGSSFEVIPSLLLTANAASTDGSAFYDPTIADWLRTATLARAATNVCEGDVIENFISDLSTCTSALAGFSYDAARACESDADCPAGLTCFASQPGSSRRGLRFGHTSPPPEPRGRCRRIPLY